MVNSISKTSSVTTTGYTQEVNNKTTKNIKKVGFLTNPSAKVAVTDDVTIKPSAEKTFFNKIEKHLNIPNENLSIYKNRTGNKYLKISRPNDSNDSEKEIYKFGKIKKGLKIKDGVLYDTNGKRQGLSKTADVFDATSYNMDSLSIGKGHYLLVPLSEIGQKQEKKGILFKTKYDSPDNIELKKAVEEYQNN